MASGSRTPPGVPVVDGVGRIPGFVNSYTYRDGDETYLIDTGFSRKAKLIVRAFRTADQPLSSVGKVLLTHHHVDHMGGAAYLLQNTPASLACHIDDAPYVDGRTKTPLPLLMRLFMRIHPAPVAMPLKDGDRIGSLVVVHAPGHTPGEVVFYDPTRKILFSGDAAVERNGQLTLPAPKFASSLEQAVGSLARLRKLDAEVLLPGHGVPVTKNIPSLLDDLIRRAPAEFLRRAAQ
ncbi:MAG TPA: MBL fold metallo-hydrolase [Thermoplasmata archaeon]|nr:MBL fold metallo-hydrolase [Thermoplasmata archaeon]